MTRADIPEALLERRLIAIVRGGDADRLDAVCDTLIANGVDYLEITTNTTGWEKSVARLADHGTVGVGTVLTVGDVQRAADAGASYIVSPHTDPALGDVARRVGLAWFPGALTPTEILTAWRAGATAVKVFPARSAGGPGYLRDVLAPLDFIPVIPTGGISADDIPAYLAAGAIAVGVGSPLMGDAGRGGSLDALGERAREMAAGARRG